MTRLLTWLKQRIGLLKTIFLISVAIIVFGELLSLSKTISFELLQTVFSQLSLWRILLMLLIGLLCVLPMVGYDLILNQILEKKQKPLYLLETSWLINTINNIAGFGGFVSIGLRSEFYGKEKDGKEVIKALSKILIYLMFGLSIFSLLSFFLVMTSHHNDYLQQYWIWLLGGGLYFPLVYLVSRFGKNTYIGGLKAKQRVALIATSFLEWAGVLTAFIATGLLMEIKLDIFQVIPLFIAASVIGIVSMMPGELGTFDVMMILGLSGLGISRETVVAWILLFRLFYYIIPFLIGITLFFKNIGTNVNERYSGIPQNLLLEILHKVEVFLLYLTGIMLILSATLPAAFENVSWLQHINPLRLKLIMQFPNILLGYLFIICGRGIAARVSRAYWPTLMLIALTTAYAFFAGFRLSTGVFLLALFVIIIFSKAELFRKQLVYAWEWLTIDTLIIGALTTLYIIIGVYNLPHPHAHHLRHKNEFFLFPSEKLWFQGFLAILIVSIAILLLVRYLNGPRRAIGESADSSRLLKILQTYGGNSDSQLVFLNDKRVFIYHDGTEDTVFLQFTIYNNKCVVMGDPSGKKSDFPDAIEAFVKEADAWNYLPVFYENSEDLVMILHDFGYDFIKFGEKAHVDLPSFTLAGKKMKGQRALNNKITKEGFTFEIVTPPFSSETFAQLQQVSEAWLQGRKEKGFSLGFFSKAYIELAPIAVVKNTEQTIVAFATFMPTYKEGLATVDLMRHDPENAPSGTMDFLFINMFDYFRSQGFTDFDLGMAPLSNVGTSRMSFTQERIAYLVYTFGSRFYSFEGLREYKEKYASEWVPRYTLYSRDSWIGYVMLALLSVDNKPVGGEKAAKRFLFPLLGKK